MMKVLILTLLFWQNAGGSSKPADDVAVDAAGGFKVSHHYQVKLQGDQLDNAQAGLFTAPKYLRAEEKHKANTQKQRNSKMDIALPGMSQSGSSAIQEETQHAANSKLLLEKNKAHQAHSTVSRPRRDSFDAAEAHKQRSAALMKKDREAKAIVQERHKLYNHQSRTSTNATTLIAARKAMMEASHSLIYSRVHAKTKVSLNRTDKDECQSTLNWFNGDPTAALPPRDGSIPIANPNVKGYTCQNYLQKRWCDGIGLATDAPQGGVYNYPEANCCECGWTGPYLNPIVGKTGVGIQLSCSGWTCAPGWAPANQPAQAPSLLANGGFDMDASVGLTHCPVFWNCRNTVGFLSSQTAETFSALFKVNCATICSSSCCGLQGQSTQNRASCFQACSAMNNVLIPSVATCKDSCSDHSKPKWYTYDVSETCNAVDLAANACCACGSPTEAECKKGCGTSVWGTGPAGGPNMVALVYVDPVLLEEVSSGSESEQYRSSIWQIIPTVPNVEYKLSFFVQSYYGRSQWSLRISNNNADGSNLLQAENFVDKDGIWHLIDNTWTATGNAAQITISINAGYVLLVDSINNTATAFLGAGNYACCKPDPTQGTTPCSSTPHWHDGDQSNYQNGAGYICQDYASQGWCTGNHANRFGILYNRPKANCCECGWDSRTPIQGGTELGTGFSECSEYTCPPGYSQSPFVVTNPGFSTMACCLKATSPTCVSFGYGDPDPLKLWTSLSHGGCGVLVLNGLCTGNSTNSTAGSIQNVDSYPTSNCCECGWDGVSVEGETGVGAGMQFCGNFDCPAGYSTNKNNWDLFGASLTACCLKAAQPKCVSTKDWLISGTFPMTSACLDMVVPRDDRSVPCTGHSPSRHDQTNHPDEWGANAHYPESNCCECGWDGVPIQGQTGLGVGTQLCSYFQCGQGYSPNPFVATEIGTSNVACCLKASTEVCVSMPTWNSGLHDAWMSKTNTWPAGSTRTETASRYGWSCSNYVVNGWCTGSALVSNGGESHNYPEANCCECGWDGFNIPGKTVMWPCSAWRCSPGWTSNPFVFWGRSDGECCTEAVTTACVSMAGWHDAAREGSYTCTDYVRFGACTGNSNRLGPSAWWLPNGQLYNYPAENCCECGWDGNPVAGKTGNGAACVNASNYAYARSLCCDSTTDTDGQSYSLQWSSSTSMCGIPSGSRSPYSTWCLSTLFESPGSKTCF